MPAAGTLPVIEDTGQARWQNWHQTVDQGVHRWVNVWNADPNRSTLLGYNGTTTGLQSLIREALASNLSIRACGGTWSFSSVASTDGILVGTQALNYRFPIGIDQSHPANAGGLPMVFVQCGMSVADLNHYLAAKGLALRTCGASNGQTIAGAVSTGTHGAALKLGAMPEFVRALHLINSPDESVWLEPASRPAIADSVPTALGARLVRDDALFAAALVSFGSFGLIHGILLEVEPIYYLRVWRQQLPLSDAIWQGVRSLDFGGAGLPGPAGQAPDHFQIVRNPYDATNTGLVTVMYRVSTPPTDAVAPQLGDDWTQGDSALEAIGLITDRFPGITGDLAKALGSVAGDAVANVCGQPGQIFRDTTTRGKGAGAALGVPVDRAKEAIELAGREIVSLGAPALLAIRLVKSSRATLGFTTFKPVTAVLDLDCPQSNLQRQLFPRVVAQLDQAGIPFTYHWGKLNDIDRSRMNKMYGQAVDRWLVARRQLLATAELRRAFANGFTDKAGLSE